MSTVAARGRRRGRAAAARRRRMQRRLRAGRRLSPERRGREYPAPVVFVADARGDHGRRPALGVVALSGKGGGTGSRRKGAKDFSAGKTVRRQLYSVKLGATRAVDILTNTGVSPCLSALGFRFLDWGVAQSNGGCTCAPWRRWFRLAPEPDRRPTNAARFACAYWRRTRHVAA